MIPSWEWCQNTGKWWVSAGHGVVGRIVRALGSSKVRLLERVLEKKMAEGTPPFRLKRTRGGSPRAGGGGVWVGGLGLATSALAVRHRTGWLLRRREAKGGPSGRGWLGVGWGLVTRVLLPPWLG